MPRERTDSVDLVALGAQVRVKQLKEELASLYRRFPALRSGGAVAPGPAGPKGATRRRGRRRKMSAAARAAVSARMKKYWARRKKNAKA